MKLLGRQSWVGYLGPLSGVAAVTACYKLLVTGVNPTTVALSLLLVILFAAAAHGIGSAILASIAGMLCFNFFFLPPFGTFTIHDPQNWVALIAFLVTATIASQLSSAARKRTREAEKSREEVWRLYQLSRAIILTPDPETAVSTISRQVGEVFNITDCQVYTPGADGRLGNFASVSGSESEASSEALLQEVFDRGEVLIHPASHSIYAPLKVGMRVTGVMLLASDALETGTVEAISGLVALALERARFLKELSRTEALRQSDRLKSSILASVSHDLRTPLTSIRAAVDNLLEKNLDWNREALREFHLIISEEVGRLTHLVQNLLEMARIEAGELHPVKEWGSVSEIVSNVLQRCAPVLSGHRAKVDLDEDTPMVKVDSRLLAEVMVNLVDNAAKYSPKDSEITIQAVIEGETLTVSVRDQGPGIPMNELSRVFDKFYRGTSGSVKGKDGTGMGLAISRGIIEEHGGRIWVESKAGAGATFFFRLPVETKTISRAAAPLGDEG
jgi:two-component system sensor histidine kinase KdpD